MKSCDYSTQDFNKRCRSGSKVTKTARVKYNEMEQDVLYLCDRCADILAREAQANRWQLTVRDYAKG